ncbi:MAG: helicase C-terminal domain-containing protein [Peptococcaceae bacterium]|nr:helicase C-terminal domain-containing protein [Peptococcaceae bacterium]
MMKKYTNFIAIDVETTGLNDDSEIIEVGLAIVENGTVARTWQSLVRPQKRIPKDIAIMTGITNEMVADAPRWADIEDELLALLDDHLLLAHNYPFDKGRLEYQLGHSLHNAWLDSHDMAKLFLPTLSSYKLMAIATHLHIPDTNHHRALNDAIVCAQVFLKLLEDASHLDPFVLHEMAVTYNGQQESLFGSTSFSLGDLLFRLAETATASMVSEPLAFTDDAFPDFYGSPRLRFDDAEAFFAQQGILAQNKPDFQYRAPQVDMLSCIKQAFETDKHALIEAGTGTGKSFAYLVPALLWSFEHDARVVIATGTINLQEQLYHADLPFLKEALGYPFATAIAKGRGNYLCLRRFSEYCRRAATASERERIFATSLVLWHAQDHSGDREHLNLNKAEIQYWQNIASAPDTCLGRRCPFYNECCYFNSKRQCEQARVVITNHSLLFQDLKIGSLLPEYDRVIIDEAHHLEDEATHQFTDTVDFELMQKLLGNFTRNGGFLGRVAIAVGKAENLAENSNTITERANRAMTDGVDAAKTIAATITFANNIPELSNIGDLRITDKIRNSGWWLTLEESLRKSHRALTTAVTSIQRLINSLDEDETIESLLREMTHAHDRLAEQRDWLERFIAGIDDSFVYWAKTYKNFSYANLLLNAAYIDIMPLVHEKLFEAKKTVVLTSATLAVNKDLNYTANKFLLEPGEYLSSINESPFDYAHHSLIAIPNDHKDYSKTNDFEYTRTIIADLKTLIPAVDGDMLVLFTSYAMLNKVQQALKDEPSLGDYRILAHGQDGSRSSLLEALQDGEKTVLLGANSFWEGVDVKGASLRTVVITKLPFTPPTMPIESARNDLLKSQGKNAFSANSLPQAVLRFRQGCGRLIRSNNDRGCIIILDNRVLTKSYGRTFLDSLPEQPIWTDSVAKLADKLEKWHQQ